LNEQAAAANDLLLREHLAAFANHALDTAATRQHFLNEHNGNYDLSETDYKSEEERVPNPGSRCRGKGVPHPESSHSADVGPCTTCGRPVCSNCQKVTLLGYSMIFTNRCTGCGNKLRTAPLIPPSEAVVNREEPPRTKPKIQYLCDRLRQEVKETIESRFTYWILHAEADRLPEKNPREQRKDEEKVKTAKLNYELRSTNWDASMAEARKSVEADTFGAESAALESFLDDLAYFFGVHSVAFNYIFEAVVHDEEKDLQVRGQTIVKIARALRKLYIARDVLWLELPDSSRTFDHYSRTTKHPLTAMPVNAWNIR
jgi:hypothetical protein